MCKLIKVMYQSGTIYVYTQLYNTYVPAFLENKLQLRMGLGVPQLVSLLMEWPLVCVCVFLPTAVMVLLKEPCIKCLLNT